jgi:1-deoxy-D-xylulose-5-phosphate synthase
MPLYHKVKDDIEDLVSHLNERTLLDRRFPGLARLGSVVLEKAMRLKEGVKNMVLPSLLFEELGFTYYGPVDGNDLDRLLPMLEDIKVIRRPVLLHVITSKGKGFGWSENHPEKGHAARPGFDVKTGTMTVEVKKTPPSWTDLFADELIALAGKDPSIVAITAAMPSGTGVDRFQERFPERTFDVGIAEEHAVIFAAGLAASGMKPVVAIYSTFLQRAFDMIIHDVCTQNLPVFFALDRGGIVGDDGETHQGVYDLGYLRMIPRMNVMAPKNDRELREMMRLGLASNLPAAVRFPRGVAPVSSGNDAPVAWGKAETLREGRDLHVLAFGPFAVEALAVAEAVAKETGRSIGVINMRWIKPLDTEAVLAAARLSGRIVTYEENALMTGGGTAVLEAIADAGVACGVKRLGVPDRFVEHGDPMEVRREIGLAPEDLSRTIKEMLG